MGRRRKSKWVGLLLVVLMTTWEAAAPVLPEIVRPLENYPRWRWVPIVVGVVLMVYGRAREQQERRRARRGRHHQENT